MKIKILVFFLILTGFYGHKSNGQEQHNDQQIDSKIDNIIRGMTLEEKIDMIGGHEAFFIKLPESLGLPSVGMADGPCGVRARGESVAYPAPICNAASWDTLVASSIGASIGQEARSKNVRIMLAPGMNMYRGSTCGRNFEYMGEDPYLAGHQAAALIRGMQAQGVMATAKHFAANNQEFDRHHTSSDMDERTLHEIYLPAFKTCVEEGNVACVMTSYNPINGVQASANGYLMNDVLKGLWGFKGIAMTDWGATYDGIAAANAGTDLEMPSGKCMNEKTLLPAIRDGRIKESTIDDKVRRMLRECYRFNLMDSAYVKHRFATDQKWSENVALEAARGGIVLLKNDHGILPIDPKETKTIAVLGPNAVNAITGGGGSSFVKASNPVSVLQGMKEIAGGKVTIQYCNWPFFRYSNAFCENTGFVGDGLRGEYFEGREMNNLIATRTDKTIAFNWIKDPLPKGVPSSNFSVRWTGKYKASETGDYDVVVNGDDGYKLFIDGKVVVEFWNYQVETARHAEFHMEKGKEYDIKLEYFQGGEVASIYLGISKKQEAKMQDALDLARKADLTVICAGFDKNTEQEDMERSYVLLENQEEYIRQIAAVSKKTVVVLNAGSNAAIANWVDNAGALLHAWYPGQMGGRAVAEILFGKVNPSGKLPISIEKKREDTPTFNSYYDDDHDRRVFFKEGIFLGYRHYDTHGVEPLFPFGFGLSYTTFEYSNLKIDRKAFTADQEVVVAVDVKNTGSMRGKEVVELYVSDPQSSLPRPEKELKAYSKIDLAPGETKTVTMKLNKNAFSFYDPLKHTWIAEPGTFGLLVGSSSRDIRLRGDVVLN